MNQQSLSVSDEKQFYQLTWPLRLADNEYPWYITW